MNADNKTSETVFSIAICRHSGDKRQSKTMLLTIVDGINVFDCRIFGVFTDTLNTGSQNNLKQGLGVIYICHFSVEKIILFPHRIGGNRKRS